MVNEAQEALQRLGYNSCARRGADVPANTLSEKFIHLEENLLPELNLWNDRDGGVYKHLRFIGITIANH